MRDLTNNSFIVSAVLKSYDLPESGDEYVMSVSYTHLNPVKQDLKAVFPIVPYKCPALERHFLVFPALHRFQPIL